LALSWVAVTLRNYTRAYLIRSFRTDDWIMLIAQVSATDIPCDLGGDGDSFSTDCLQGDLHNLLGLSLCWA
jgi:hypothetical protein